MHRCLWVAVPGQLKLVRDYHARCDRRGLLSGWIELARRCIITSLQGPESSPPFGWSADQESLFYTSENVLPVGDSPIDYLL